MSSSVPVMPVMRSVVSDACYAFERGECNRGDTCRFSHNINDDGSGSQPQHGAIASNACFAYLRGECNRGSSCRFAH